ncbi:MAG TPA: hypothetical protein VGF07_01590 [Stellaceae bacterium]|jgi:hypothetical protein
MKKRALAAAAAALGAAVAASAHAGVSLQGPRLTGIALQSLEASRPVVVTGDDLAFGRNRRRAPADNQLNYWR